MPSRAALMRLTAGTRDGRWNNRLNEAPLVPELVTVLDQPWYAGIVNPPTMECQREKPNRPPDDILACADRHLQR